MLLGSTTFDSKHYMYQAHQSLSTSISHRLLLVCLFSLSSPLSRLPFPTTAITFLLKQPVIYTSKTPTCSVYTLPPSVTNK